MTIQERMEKVRAKLLLSQPFFGVLLAQVEIIREDRCGTAATDGLRIYYNKEFISKLKNNELLAVFLHEILHIIYLHCDQKRVGTRIFPIWTIAADYVINLDIKEMGKEYKLPFQCLLDKKFEEMSTEQVYEKLLKKESSDLLKWIKKNEENLDKLIPSPSLEKAKDMILQAWEATKNGENLPTGVQRAIKKLQNAKAPWERILHRFIGQAVARDDFSYSRYNKHYSVDEIYLPSLHSNIIGDIVVAIDTSSSIDDRILTQFVAELKKLNSLTDSITVMSCDAEVHEITKIYKLDAAIQNIKLKGGGGTDFRPVFNKVEKMKLQPELLIFLTDAQGSFPKKAPSYPVLWCVMGDEKVPWGFRIQVQL